MRFGIPLLDQRVAPRCTIADRVLLITVKRRRILEESAVPLDRATWMDLTRILSEERVDALVCGGISRSTRETVESQAVEVIDNVAGTAEEVVDALRCGGLHPGFGFASEGSPPETGKGPEKARREAAAAARTPPMDCLACPDRVCLRAQPCPWLTTPLPGASNGYEKTLEAAWDVACEEERTLCRLAELVYFALEMGYTKLGVAFCEDLLEPASVLTRVLRRFFQVVPVCCKVRRNPGSESRSTGAQQTRSAGATRVAACDPVGQAAALNAAGTDLNVLVGLCVGVDGVFSRESRAPVTTIFVKDKSLANNPIGAVYSHYHMEDI
ncbi:MAG: DUF1847 domain-containing protein [Gemmatimonadetes bacterium]|nr:DUF1847 domain-containing protein [Gemmatimonadota bacterium]